MVFWLFNALNKEHTANLQYPVSINYDRNRFVPVGKLPSRIPLNVTGKGWNLLAASLGFRTEPVAIDPATETGTTRMGADELIRGFAPALGRLSINYFSIDSLAFAFEPRMRRKVALVPDLSGLVMLQGFEPIAPVRIAPDSVVLDGPASTVSSVPDPMPVKPVEDRISGEYRRSVLINAGSGIKTKPLKAEISFLSIRMKTFTVRVPVRVENGEGNRKWKSDTDSISVTLRMRADNKNKLLEFRSTAVVKPVGRSRVQKSLPVLEGLPPGIRVISLDSVIIRRN